MKNNIEEKLIGNGSYADVYSFKEPITGKKFAIKKLKTDVKGKEIERFKREYNIMKKISHPYILEVYSYNDESYTMEYCDYTLGKYIEKNNNKDFMNFDYRKNMALQFLEGMKFLHNKDILHRDISCNNILVKPYDDNIVILKISDFGLLKDLNLDMTSTNSEIRGTFIDDTLKDFKNYNKKNEMYSIGRVLYFIFTGKMNVVDSDSELGKIIGKCISRTVEERFDDVDEIINKIKKLEDTNKGNNTNVLNLKGTNSSKKVTGRFNADDMAFVILKAMIEDGDENKLYYIRSLDGESIQTSSGKFRIEFETLSSREKAYWKSALDMLINNDLINALNYKNEIFEVTQKGYELYDNTIDN